jgi:hypothetical protein
MKNNLNNGSRYLLDGIGFFFEKKFEIPFVFNQNNYLWLHFYPLHFFMDA